METKCHPCVAILLISFSTSGPSPAQVTHLYSGDDVDDDDDDEWLNVLQPVIANATAHANSVLNNLLVIDA
jgi:hypothetical protein